MKKFLRLISLTLSALLICLAFCGCDNLEESRKYQAFWKDDEKNSIILNEKEYKLLPESRLLDPFCETLYDYWVTDSEVPLLLKETYGENCSLSADGDFIVLDSVNDTVTRVYCVADRYEEICNRIEETAIDYYCYEYEDYDIDDGSYKTQCYCLTSEEVDAVLTVLNSGERTEKDVYEYSTYIIEINRCSEDMVFRTYAFDLVFMNSKAYLVVDSYDKNYNETNLNPQTIIVPDELYHIFYQMADKYISGEYW